MKTIFLHLCLLCCAFSCYSQNYSEHPKKSYLPKEIRHQIKPYRLKSSHSVKQEMDVIFKTQRATENLDALTEAGFTMLCQQPRSFICVAKHSLLPGYLVKLAFDDTLKKKKGVPFWKWFVRRCENAKLIRSVIKANRLNHFCVARKWIYSLPEEPSPPNTPLYERKFAVLLVTDMNLVPDEENFDYWRNSVTRDVLNELFIIASNAKRLTLRPDNIWLTKEGKIAFIDTEYSNRKTNFHRIGEYLSSEMREYWEYLIKIGGPSWY